MHCLAFVEEMNLVVYSRAGIIGTLLYIMHRSVRFELRRKYTTYLRPCSAWAQGARAAGQAGVGLVGQARGQAATGGQAAGQLPVGAAGRPVVRPSEQTTRHFRVRSASADWSKNSTGKHMHC